MKDFNDSPIELMGRGITYIYLVVMLLVFPLYYYDGFVGLAGKKIDFFIMLTGLFFIIGLIPFVKHIVFGGHKIRNTCTITDLFGVSLLLCISLSTVFSVDRQETLCPIFGQQMGFFVVFLCLAAYFLVRCFAKLDGILLWCYLIGSSGIYLWGILLSCKINLFYIQETFYKKEEVEIIVSPMGHINYNAAFLALALPPAIAMFLNCKEEFTKNVLKIYLFLGFLDMFFIRSDSIYVAMAAAFCVFVYFALGSKVYFQRFCEVICLMAFAGIVIFSLYKWAPDRVYPMLGIGNLFLKNYVFIAEIVIIFAVYFAGNYYALSEESGKKLQKIWKNFLILSGIAGVFGLLFVNIFLGGKLTGSIWESLLLTDSFGSYRGYLWRRIPGIYKNFSVIHKLFGCGLNCFTKVFFPPYKEELLQITGTVLYGAHNEFLNILIEWGILGIISYFGMIFGTFFYAVKNRDKNSMNVAVIATICSYLGQGFVNHPSIFNLPLFMIFLGLANSKEHVSDTPG